MKIGTTIDYYVLVAFFLILIGIGVYFARRMKGGKDFFSGGNRLPWWVSGISLYMGSFSAWTFTGAAGFIYHTEWYGLTYLAIWSVACLIGSQITAGKWRRTRVISPVEYTKTRFNKPTQQIIGYVVVINALFGLGITLAAVAKVIAYSMDIPIEMVILVSGVAILLYTYMGGLWAVAVADVIQFIILIAITIVIFPLALNLVGGFDVLFSKLGSFSFSHNYKGENYDFVWIFAILLVNILSSANQAQRYYSVKDEKSARKVGIFCGLLYITVPILFGIPPLIAKVLWPDLLAVPFFQTQIVPAESVFVAIVLQVLPNGLIGVFMAAMFAATLSTLDSAYNSTAAVIAKDLYGGIFKPHANDAQIMKFGRVATFFIGIVTIITAIVYSKSQFGLFNWMTTFVAFFNVPMLIPVIFGLLFKNLRRWSGFATIIFGMVFGVIVKFLLGWGFGPQMLGTIILCSTFILSSDYMAKVYKKNKINSFILSVCVTFFFIIFSRILIYKQQTTLEMSIMYLLFVVLGICFYIASWVYSRENDEDRKEVNQFFEKLKRPIDVLEEVYSKGVKEVSSFPIIGKLTVLIGILISILAFFNMTSNEIIITISLSIVLIIVGASMSYLGGRSERVYVAKMQAELDKREKSAKV